MAWITDTKTIEYTKHVIENWSDDRNIHTNNKGNKTALK